jgi:hypothetical protein
MLVLPGKAYSKKLCEVHQLQVVKHQEFENLNTNKNFVQLFTIQWLIDAKGTFKLTENITFINSGTDILIFAFIFSFLYNSISNKETGISKGTYVLLFLIHPYVLSISNTL